MSDDDAALIKRATGLTGFDSVTGGGLPAAGATLVLGEPGSGKTILGLNIIAEAIGRGEGALFISFEESREQILRDAASFDWGPTLAQSPRWKLVDVRPAAHAEAAGGFDLEGLLAGVDAQTERLDASWIIVDGIDRLLRLQPETDTAVGQVARLSDWARERGRTLVLTGKSTHDDRVQPAYLEGLEFMLDTVIVLSAELVQRRLNRRLRIAKYRGTAHAADELALVIDARGLHVPYDARDASQIAPASTERVGTGVTRLDKLLDGGPYRGSTVLVSGQPGTAKTTLSVAFAHAAANRGERVLYISFDEYSDRIVRNVASVGIDLEPAIAAGKLHFRSRHAGLALIEAHYVDIRTLLDEIAPECLVIDPVSALLKADSAETGFIATERLIGEASARGTTTLLTSLTAADDAHTEATLSHVSTVADTWITLGYQIRGGERNRSLSIVKSRGSGHSNQVRELLLSASGIDLADVYQYGSEVLMGTARIQRESEEAAREREAGAEQQRRERELERALQQARLRSEKAQSEVERLADELEGTRAAGRAGQQQDAAHREAVMRRRDPDRDPEDADGHER